MKILVVGSIFDIELANIVESLKNKNAVREKLANFYEGIYQGKQVIVCQPPVGMINAAAAVTWALEKYKPDYILNIGVANGYLHIHVGEVVVGLSTINISSMKTETHTQGQKSSPDNWELISYRYGERDRLIDQKANEDFVDKFKGFEIMNESKNINYGVIGSGDIVNKEYDRIEFLADNYNVLCEDMAGVAVYTVANAYNVPALDIRIVSKNESMREREERDTGLKLQSLILKFIEYM